MKHSEDTAWQAVVNCDPSYDGSFWYAVKTVGVYCKPSCKSRTPLRKNVVFWDSAKDAEAAGFRACKRCRPDLDEYLPAKELAAKIKEMLDQQDCKPKQLTVGIRQLGVSPNHAAMVFKKQYGLSPTAYVNQKRAAKIKALLSQSDMPIIDIAESAGFSSLSAFYSFFKKHVSTTPKAYRNGLSGAQK